LKEAPLIAACNPFNKNEYSYMDNIQMVDLKGQYHKIKNRVDEAILNVIETSTFIQGPEVRNFESDLSKYLNGTKVISCANGTDALQIALMALGLKPGDEVIVPSFTYVATAEVIGLLGLTPVMIDVDPDFFNITAELVAPAITNKTKAIIPVHLFGQCSDMEGIMPLARENNIKVIEDTAQTIGAVYTLSNGDVKQAGTMGDIGCTSFFPSKNLGCYGDGGALFTNDDMLAANLKMISNHGQRKKYYHEVLGVNSRLDTLQAAILRVKLEHLDEYCNERNKVAAFYDEHLKNTPGLKIPARNKKSSHVFHQYTIRVTNGKRNELQAYLKEKGIPSMIYYPLPLFEQDAYKAIGKCVGSQDVTKMLCEQVLSLPIHTELNHDAIAYIVECINSFFYGQ